ncbi:hypothetical protein FS837_003638 [Tulasnella sp. UAMH 9824]|nr:hypothetical protein FS837_003638 [Tulasnella sp. UAMH 9824]
MPFGFFKGVTADVKLSDDEYVQNEKERYVPFSVNPFRERQETKQEGSSNSEEETERPPEWLELAGDLAWTASFSSLTSSTRVTEPISVWNYGVFFALTWHLWATQTTYDIKYYTNDWWHRAFFASQLGIYAILAAFSGSFNVGWEVDGDAMDPFVGNNTALTAQAIRQNESSGTAGWAQVIRWFWTGVHGVFLLFNEEPDPEAEFKFTTYISYNDSTIFNDSVHDGEVLPLAWMERYLELMSYTGHWLVAVSGTLLLCMAIVNIMQRRPRNRFAWGYSLHRAAIGVLILVGGSTSNKQDSLSWMFWMVPTVTIFFGLVAIIDLVILRFSIVSIRKKEKDIRGPDLYAGGEKGGYTSGRGANLRQLSELSYGPIPLSQRDATGSSMSMDEKTYPAEEAFDPDAEAGPYRPHRQGTRGSSIDSATQSLLGRKREGGILNLLS